MSQVEVGVEEARKVLGSLITAAARDGQVAVISKGGIPAAALVPLELLRQISPMTCMSCGEAILASEAHQPCRNCGSVDRVVALSDHGTATDAIAGVEASLPRSPRPWQATWAEIESRLDRLGAGMPAAARSMSVDCATKSRRISSPATSSKIKSSATLGCPAT
jgi:antitoxin (DNA-binding transcriptional repressor) of toxin-antitoxin stability system